MRDYETKIFNLEEDAINFFTEQSKTDVWKRVFISEMKVKPLEDNPIMLKEIAEELNMESVSDEAILSTMADKKLALSFPLEKIECRPIRYTAFNTLCQRAGLSGSALTCYDNKLRQSEMPPANKAIVLNYGLECFHGSKALILLRNEKVSAVLSGDPMDYSILPVSELLKCLCDGLRKEFDNVKFSLASTNHEISIIDFVIKDKVILEKVTDILSREKVTLPKSASVNVKFATSDVGLSGANLYPMVIFDMNGVKAEMMLGSPLKLAHKSGNSVVHFENNVRQLATYFQETAEKVAKLNTIFLTHPYGCFKAVAHKLGLPKNEALETAEEFDLMRPEHATAYDMFWYMWEIVNRYEKNCTAAHKKVDISKKINLQESIARIVNMDIKQFDHDHNWE